MSRKNHEKIYRFEVWKNRATLFLFLSKEKFMNAFLVILVSFFLLVFSFSVYFIIDDDRSGSKALFFSVFLRVFLGYALTALVVMIVSIIIAIFFAMLFNASSTIAFFAFFANLFSKL